MPLPAARLREAEGVIAEQGAEPDELSAPDGHVRDVGGALTLEFSTVIGGNRVNDDEAYFMSRQQDGHLVLEDVILRLEIRGDGAVNAIQGGWSSCFASLPQDRVPLEHLG
ncbi:hypothetical protein Trco_004305 [Trichoderma cornu-damae]|uniref:Uncharacterized protein n=1 Tax=Trichoderma cornu-damae TaxID=654480 RepID=A0A9P8QT02_9HYPO|nr:hypothetical protein Trco_004305 [Trichoderma cornu-damae]